MARLDAKWDNFSLRGQVWDHFEQDAAASGSAVEVNATTVSLVLTEYPASITQDVTVNAGTDALVLTEYAAALTQNVTVNAGTDALTLTEYPASLSQDVSISSGVQALALTTYPATLTQDVTIEAGSQALALTTYAATVELGSAPVVVVAPPSGAGRSRSKGRIAIRYDDVVYLFQTVEEAQFWLESLAVKEDVKPITVIQAPKKIRQLVRKVNKAVPEDDEALILFLLEVA